VPVPRISRLACAVLAWQFIVFHGLLAPGLYQFKNSYFAFAQHAIAQAEKSLPFVSEKTAGRFILVNTPVYFYFVANVAVLSAVHKHLIPLTGLTAGMNPLTITRPDTYSLIITAEKGSLTGMEQLQLRTDTSMQSSGDRFELDGMAVKVLETRDGLASSSQFRFNVPLEDQKLKWFSWIDNRYAPFDLPAVGETIQVRPAVWDIQATRQSFTAARNAGFDQDG
jgi:hypothetical protein